MFTSEKSLLEGAFTADITYQLNPYEQNKLSALVSVKASQPLKYEYTVLGKTSDVNFMYGVDTFASDFDIPVVGLYANTTTQVVITFIDEADIREDYTLELDTSGMDFGLTALIVDYQITDQDMFDATIGQGWLVTNLMNGYDRNGDLRMTGLWPYLLSSMKMYDGALYQSMEEFEGTIAFSLKYGKTDLLGKVTVEYPAPEGYSFHHDITWDNDGHMYALGHTVDEPTDEKKAEAHLFKYDNATGELLWSRDYSKEYMGTLVLSNEFQNDVHWNSLDYVPELDQIIVDARSNSAVIGIDPHTGDFLWVLNDPSYNRLEAPLFLEVINPPENFRYFNGQHTAFITKNPAYQQFWGDNKFVMSVFDNRSCLFDDGTDNLRLMEDPFDEDYFAADIPAVGYVMAVDLNEGTAEPVYRIEFEGQRTEFAGGIFEHDNYYTAAIDGTRTFIVFGTDDNIGVKVTDLNSEDSRIGGLYRARIFTYDQLRSLL